MFQFIFVVKAICANDSLKIDVTLEGKLNEHLLKVVMTIPLGISYVLRQILGKKF